MNKMQTHTPELVSALADSQLTGEEFARGVEWVTRDVSAREAWQCYHLIGDVLRSSDLAGGTKPERFLSRLQERLVQESLQAKDQMASPLEVHRIAPTEPANDASFRWKLVAGLASVTAVAAIGWTVVSALSLKPEQAQLASAPSTTIIAGSERGPMIRDPRLDELLAAHRQLGGAPALPMPAGFLRNATFEGAGR
jgi:sigma-E factor negative regulatory protein RseA